MGGRGFVCAARRASAGAEGHLARRRLSYNERRAMSILDRYVWKELGPPFAIGVGVFTFFLFIDRIYQLTNLVITKNVPFHLVFSLLIFMLPPFLTLTDRKSTRLNSSHVKLSYAV